MVKMQETEYVSTLIGDIYDAALDPAGWPRTLRRSAQFIGSLSAAIYARDINKSGSNFYDDGGIEPESIRSYFKKYIRLDPFQIAHFFAEPEQLMSTTDVMPFDELFETRFYKEWARPLDLADTLTTTLDKSSGWAAFLTIFRHKRDGIF